MPDPDIIRAEEPEAREVETKEFKSSFVDEPETNVPDEAEEVPQKRDGYEEPPEYDPIRTLSTLNRHADEAANRYAAERDARLRAEAERLPGRLPPEEELLRMSERDRMALTQAFNRRQQIDMYRRNILPQQYETVREQNRAKAQTIVQMQQSLQSKYPNEWPEVLDEARALVDSGQLTADSLADPATYEVLHTIVLGNKVKEQAGRQNLRRMAAGASLAGNGGAQEASVPGVAADVPPSVTEARLRKMQLSESQIKSTLRRMYPGLV